MAAEERRQQLIAAALELYGSRPYEQVSIDDITAAADVSRALFYRYFSSTWDIYLAGTRSAAEWVVKRFTTPTEGPLLDQLRHALGEFLSYAEAHSMAFITLLRNGSVIATAETDAMIDDVRHQAVRELLARAGVADPSHLTQLTLRCWIAVVEGATLSHLQERSVPADQLQSWLIDQLIAMMAATAAHDPAAAAALTEIGPNLTG